ncbi:kinesin-like protein KIF19 [Helicoverpa zea]|uniref:kinesin-like protein KIF19 n=1 Tax=Helicoverpa zea TaxID=7113 RepID=UPI001F5A4CD4|nr:kinesin-like protein KIF19 [Helicoverpa zea]XP_049699933.1 kinesin-like protein KIF19 [Helicoverpa armigera]
MRGGQRSDAMTQSSLASEKSHGSIRTVSEEKLMVAVRVRPQRADEGPRIVHVVSDKMLVLEEEADSRRDVLRQRRLNDKHYIYDRVFGEGSTQEDVYDAVCAPLVGDTLKGFAGAVFAYGATGAGKTYTMTGLMSRALSHLFASIAESEQPDSYEVKMSYIEIYNEIIRDLLNPSAGPLELRDEGGSGAPVVAGLSELKANSAAHVAELLARGDRSRTAEPTHANQHSSRGHALLSVTVSQQVEKGTQRGRLFLIDLAGSERAGLRSRRLEGAHINRSLLALGNCIMALSGGARYVNYRDSKLTRLLREVLGGRCRTAMVAHVAPGAAHRDTTRSTLHYAQKASSITNKVERELVETPMPLSQYRTVINELREEIARLKLKMKDDRTIKPKEFQMVEEEVSKEDAAENAAHLKSLREAIVSTFKQQMRLRRRLMELDSHLLGLALDAERQHAAISHWEARFNRLYKPINIPGSRLSTQQSYRGGTGLSSSSSERAEAEVAVEQAWAELAAVEREQESARTERERVERQLEQVRLRGAQLEQELPATISSGPEREVLALVCRVHELEADKLALQGERAARAHELRRRDLALQRRDAQRRLSDEIITRQRRALQDVGVGVPPELAQLYELYQQEIHASTYTESNDIYTPPYRLPPISTSMSELTWSESSSGSGRGSSSGSGGTLAYDYRLPRLAPTPRPRTRYSQASASALKRYASDDSLVTAGHRGDDEPVP